MKHLIHRVLAVGTALTLLGGTLPAFAAESGGMAAQRNGQDLTLPAAQIRSNRTVVPAQALADLLGAQLSAGRDSATLTLRDVSVTLTAGSPTVTVVRDGQTDSFSTDVAPFSENGSLYLPLRSAAQSLGFIVGWDADTATVLLRTPSVCWRKPGPANPLP
ncbi:MAG: copper amine oxidase N-terminal domain-containing protein [Clostridiales bacterium]|nr:copper amine oxidase N-terminal domain-containing protein [Clostridiales bacterium]